MKVAIIHPNMTSILESDQIKVDINEMNKIENSSCISLHLADCMDFVIYEQRKKLLKAACSKVRMNGEITISGTDIFSVCHYIDNNLTTLEQINSSLFSGRLSISNIVNVTEDVLDMGFFIVNAKTDGLFYSIKAIRKN